MGTQTENYMTLSMSHCHTCHAGSEGVMMSHCDSYYTKILIKILIKMVNPKHKGLSFLWTCWQVCFTIDLGNIW